MKDETDRVQLGSRLRAAREYRGFSQDDVARHLGVPRSAVSLMESGSRRVEALELKRLSELYSCTMEELTGSSDESQPPESVQMLARAASALSPEDRQEVLQFAEFLRSQRESKN